jgi:hypothetical protein
MFGQYIEEKGKRFRTSGAQQQQAVAMAVAEFMGEVASTVQITQRVGLQIRDILTAQHRFRSMPGKRAVAFIARPGFAEALEYLRFTSNGSERKLINWWERFIPENPLVHPQETASEKPATARVRSRRRRRGKKQAGPSATAE